MQSVINEKVSVLTFYNHLNGSISLKKINWRGRVYSLTQLGYHHKVKEGTKLCHIFSVCNQSLAFRLKLDTDNLHWTLEAISDGNPD